MLKKKIIVFLSLIISLIFVVTGCQNKQNQNVYKEVKSSKTINWGVKADTPLFGAMSIRTGKI